MSRAGYVGWAVFWLCNAAWSAYQNRWGWFPIEAGAFAYCAFRAATRRKDGAA